MTRTLLTGCALLLALSGCDSSGPGDDDDVYVPPPVHKVDAATPQDVVYQFACDAYCRGSKLGSQAATICDAASADPQYEADQGALGCALAVAAKGCPADQATCTCVMTKTDEGCTP